MYVNKTITKEIIDKYFNELAKDYKKKKGVPIELIIIGGASIVLNYDFRESTSDVDAYYPYSEILKDAIFSVAEKENLKVDWLNNDFRFTDSFSPMISVYSKYYRTFSNLITIRVLDAEYLLAMKLKSFRLYKYDLSDIVGIIWKQAEKGDPIQYEKVVKAVGDLYGERGYVSEEALQFAKDIIESNDYENLYNKTREQEIKGRDALRVIDQKVHKRLTSREITEEINKLIGKE